MVSFFNKWLVLFSLPFMLLQVSGKNSNGSSVQTVSRQNAPHPFHVSVIEINHNGADQTLEISCKLFTDDFESVLSRNYQVKADLINPSNPATMDSVVKKYLFSHLSLKVEGKPVAFNYIGFENEKEAAYGYIEVENVATVRKLDVETTIMYDQFEDQVNIIHAIVKGERKSNKLNFPDKHVAFNF